VAPEKFYNALVKFLKQQKVTYVDEHFSLERGYKAYDVELTIKEERPLPKPNFKNLKTMISKMKKLTGEWLPADDYLIVGMVNMEANKRFSIDLIEFKKQWVDLSKEDQAYFLSKRPDVGKGLVK
jgi:hypothetical protein